MDLPLAATQLMAKSIGGIDVVHGMPVPTPYGPESHAPAACLPGLSSDETLVSNLQRLGRGDRYPEPCSPAGEKYAPAAGHRDLGLSFGRQRIA